MITAVPSVTEVTIPDPDTVATDALDVVQLTVGFEITVPLASFTVGVRVDVAPSDENVRLVGDSVIDEAP